MSNKAGMYSNMEEPPSNNEEDLDEYEGTDLKECTCKHHRDLTVPIEFTRP